MGRKRRGRKRIDGWLAIHKAAGITSTGVVNRVRGITGAAKAGHGGTLDPFCEGLLPIALGSATKTIGMILEGDKAYRCTVCFGKETDSGDLTGEVVSQSGQRPERAAIEEALSHFLGEIEQIPPAHSAVRIDGQRAYERVRRGETVEMPPRRVVIHSLKLISYDSSQGPHAVIDVTCGKGTYMRALARDLGRLLGCGAHLSALLRTKTLKFTLNESITLESLRESVHNGGLNEVLLPVDRVLDDIPALRLDQDAWHRVGHGQEVWIPTGGLAATKVRLQTPEGTFAALGEFSGAVNAEGLRLCRPRRLFITS